MSEKNGKSWLKVGIPEDAAGPIEIFEPSATLRMAVVERSAIKTIDKADWQKPGVYVLLYRHDDDRWPCYIGKATASRGLRAGFSSTPTTRKKDTGTEPS